MPQTAHTPGPWIMEEVTSGPLNLGSYIVCGKSEDSERYDRVICTVEKQGQVYEKLYPVNHKANAILIKAAPDLLTTLRDLIDACLNRVDSGALAKELFDAEQAYKFATGEIK